MSAAYDFLPWVRSGLIGAVRTPDVVDSLDVGVAVTLDGETEPATVRVHVRGPGDVTGIEPSAVRRTFPRRGTTDFESNLFPAIEFHRPDFPWLFTPAGVADIAGGLAPWVVLLVVEQQAGITVRAGEQGPLPVLEIASPAVLARELFDLSQAWAWTHAQVAAPTPTSDAALDALLVADDAHAVSRVVCPRNLRPETHYVACLVPAWSAGVEAGLGHPITTGMRPAWTWPPPLRVELPVYYQWEFSTGAAGDFASLARQLRGRDLPPTLGKRDLDVGEPGLGMTSFPDTVIGMEGAIHPMGATPSPWPSPARETFQSEMRDIFMQVSGTAPVLGPPSYGATAIEIEGLDHADTPAWVRELDLDARNRAAAGLGEEVVRRRQEELVTRAWQQLGEIQAVEALLARAQLADVIGDRLHRKHVAAMPRTRVLALARPAHARIAFATANGTRRTLGAVVAESALAVGALTPAFRKLTRTDGPAARRASTNVAALVERLDQGALEVAPAHRAPDGTAVLDLVSAEVSSEIGERVRFALATPARVESASRAWDVRVPRRPRQPTPTRVPVALARRRTVDDIAIPDLPDEVDPGDDPGVTVDMFRAAAVAHQHYLVDVLHAIPRPRKKPPLSVVASTFDAVQLTAALHPRRALVREVGARVRGLVFDANATDPFAPQRHRITLDDAAFEWLRDVSAENILPGLGGILPETATLLRTNRRFVESFMIGINQSLRSELRWRRFPSERYATPIRSFWKHGVADIPELGGVEWRTGNLGDHATRGDPVLFLIRGALVTRYPNAIVTAVPAALGANGRSPAEVAPITPVFQVTIDPDILVVAFELGPVDENALVGVSGDPARAGWYFVIQEHPTEPRFGLAAPPTPGVDPATLTSWRELTWGHFADSAAGLAALSHIPLAGRVADRAPVLDSAPWGRDAGELAFITLRRPASIAFHASTLLRK